VDIVFKSLIHNVFKMRTFGAVAIVVFTIVLIFFHRIPKPAFCLADVRRDLRKVGKL
jgi:hypothetical protein